MGLTSVTHGNEAPGNLLTDFLLSAQIALGTLQQLGKSRVEVIDLKVEDPANKALYFDYFKVRQLIAQC